MKIWEADVEDRDYAAQPGTVCAVGKDFFTVQTGDGSLSVKELQIPGKKRMDAGAFLRGYQINEGIILK